MGIAEDKEQYEPLEPFTTWSREWDMNRGPQRSIKRINPSWPIVDTVDVKTPPEVTGLPSAEAVELFKKAQTVPAPKPSEQQVGGDHYKSMAIQPTSYITANGLGWCEGNAVKYITRYKQKGGRKDIEKAIHYLNLLLEIIDKQSD